VTFPICAALILGVQLMSAEDGSTLATEVGHAETNRNFVSRRGVDFYLNHTRFRVAGVNNHYLPWGSRQEVTRVLDDAVAMHANVVRTFIGPIIGSLDGGVPTIWDWRSKAESSNLGVGGAFMAYWNPATQSMAINEGPDGLQRIDFIVNEATKRKLHLIIAFLDYWSYTGGAPQMSAWHGGAKNDRFFAEDPRTRADYKLLVRTIVTRINGLSGLAYKDDPTIFAWELMNEPEIQPISLFYDWAKEMAAYVKSLDPKHMVASGHSSRRTKLVELQIPDIDFGTWHGYPAYERIDAQAFGALIMDYCARAKAFNKPLILEEFGLARSNPDRPEVYRDWLEKIRANDSCAGWLVWRLVSRQDSNKFPADDHDQFDIHNDGSAVWRVLQEGAFSLTSASRRRDYPTRERQG
jgi:mannan endo-1,4-beta-mannosidase